ncbi:PREDICTED: acyl-CoA synthetase family member 4 [Papilio polytes]|uniref:acyl-CoA synthetase family member 4 n=1 Tax=Papilio polytes TaxID=76194 RepID=UPI0006766E18|nr:PREDICTED: acyl-CoA synthetase family member 4 [Papilio polytes]
MKSKRGFYDVFVKTCAVNPSKKAVRQYKNETYNTYTYSELFGVCEYISQILLQLDCNREVIGLVTDRNVIVPCAIAAVHKCCNSFMFLDPAQSIENEINDIKLKIIISIQDTNEDYSMKLCEKKPDKTIVIFDYTINFFKQESNNLLTKKWVMEHCFIASTSGSTGKKKHVQVPVQCIQPNIDDLTKLFNIDSSDVIYFSTPLTFDPSMVEILLAFKNGASLLIAPEYIDILFPHRKEYSITVWQTTPSKFFQHSNCDIKNKILSADSTLKILALGGEPLNGVRRLRELKHVNNTCRIFTLYGVTEMSCWACVAELDLNKITTDREVPLGNCLSETQLHIDSKNSSFSGSGKIILVSNTRKCYILNNKRPGSNEECSLKFVDTGDIGEVSNGTVYYRGRKDDIIKRFGNKINLQYIENTVMQCSEVKTCSCIWLPKLMLLVLYYSSETIKSHDLSILIKGKLEEKHWPDKIIKVDNLPTNLHGKTSKQILSTMFENDLNKPTIPATNAFLEELTSMLRTTLPIEEIKNKNYQSIGGTSFLAIAMCNKLSHTYPQLGNFILPYLISNNKTIQDIVQLVEKDYSYEEMKSKKRTKKPDFRSKRLAYALSEVLELDRNLVEFQELWKFDTGKCVDASPTLCSYKNKVFVAVCSHSGKIAVIDTESGRLQGQIKLNSRIEASIHCFDGGVRGPCGVVGSYDGTIVCFTIHKCQEIWRTNVRYMIKSKASYIRGVIYVASYDGIVRCLDAMNGEIKQTIQVAEQAISADTVLAKNGYIMVGTLSGVCAGIDTRARRAAWRGKLASPVFARPALYDDDKYVVFAEVNGDVHCRTVEKGIKVWKYEGARGNIFSSVYIKNLDALTWQFIFGCHDNGVYSITVKNFRSSLHWRTEMTSPVYATPCCLDNTAIIATSTNGKMCVISTDNGTIISEYQFPNETFSSPAVSNDKIFIGCRNDYLYCIKFKSLI